MLNNGAVIDFENVKPAGAGIIGLSMLNAVPNHRSYILKRMLRACCIKNLIELGINPIDSAVNIEEKGQLTTDIYLDVIEQLVEAGCDLDQQDRHGNYMHLSMFLGTVDNGKAINCDYRVLLFIRMI